MKTNWTNTIWTTKSCQSLITDEIDKTIHQYLKHEFNRMGCEVKVINGTSDHVHCLINVNSKRSLDEIIKMVKGSSSHRINHEGVSKEKFTWQKSYDAGSVGKTEIENELKKILNQKSIHANSTITIQDEINELHRFD